MKKIRKNILLSRMLNGIAIAVSGDDAECNGKDGCPAVGVDSSGKLLRIIGPMMTKKQKTVFEAETGARVGYGECLMEVPLALLEAAGFSKK